MDITISFPNAVINIPIPKLNKTVELELEKIKDAGWIYLIGYGARQSFNDSIASFSVDALVNSEKRDEAEAALDKRIKAVYGGTVSAGVGRGSTLAGMIRRVLEESLGARFRKLSTDDKAKVVDSILSGRHAPDVLKTARSRLATKPDIDLASILK